MSNIRNFVRDIVGWALVGGALRALRAQAADVKSPEEAFSFAMKFGYCGIHITPGQHREEILRLLEIVAKEQPKRVLEIGTAGGGTFFLFAQVAADDALLISADLPQGKFGGGYPLWRSRLIRAFARDRQRIELLRVDSHAPETLRSIKEILGGQPLDFLFIDGDHRYEGVKADFEMYSPLVRPGGWIGFHDIVPGPADEAGGVSVFWQELKKQYPVQEFVRDWKQNGYGIGVMNKPE